MHIPGKRALGAEGRAVTDAEGAGEMKRGGDQRGGAGFGFYAEQEGETLVPLRRGVP